MAHYKHNDYLKEFIDSVDREIDSLKNRAQTISNSSEIEKSKAIQGIADFVEKKKLEFQEAYNEFYSSANRAIIHKPTYYSTDKESVPTNVWLEPQMPTANDLLMEAEGRVTLPELLLGDYEVLGKGVLDKKRFSKYIKWQSVDEAVPGNFYISFPESQRKEVVHFTNDWLLRLFMAFSPGDLTLSFIDPLLSGNASFFEKGLAEVPELFSHKVFSSGEDIREHIEFLMGRMEFVSRTLPPNTSAVEHYQNQGRVENAYHVLVVYDVLNLRSTFGLDLLKPLILNGNKYGIYVVFVQPKVELVNDNKILSELLNASSILKIEKRENPSMLYDITGEGVNQQFQHITAERHANLGVYLDSSAIESPLINNYFGSLKELLKNRKEQSKLTFNYESFKDKAYAESYTEFNVPIGEAEGRLFNFSLDVKDHVHSFALGRTGSGKSVLLNAILTSSVLKYSPDSLHLYLMDFKEGGTEFIAYKGLPHVRALLTDNSDAQIALDILQDIRKQMEVRGELIAEFGGERKNLEHYNEVARVKLPRIILAVDECHLLFNVSNHQTQDKINEIISYIATQGRSQGIHLLFGTQTASSLLMPENVFSNLTDIFVLRSYEMDATRMLNGSAKLITQITKPGQAIYKHNNNTTLLQPFLVEKDYLVKLVAIANQKANDYVTKHQLQLADSVFFGGGVRPRLDEVKELNPHHAVALGLEVSVQDAQYLSIPLQQRKGGTNLLVLGNRETLDGQAEENAMRVCLASILSTIKYYKRANKPFAIYVINKYEEDAYQSRLLVQLAKDPANCLHLIERRADVEELFKKMIVQINANDEEKKEVFLYILGQHLFRELRRDEVFRVNDVDEQKNGEVEYKNRGISKDPSFALPISQGGAEGLLKMASDEPAKQINKQITYKGALNYILIEGPEKGIHTIIQVPKLDDLLFEGATRTTLGHFGYFVLLSMSNIDSERITENREVTTEDLSTESKKVRAYLYNDMGSKTTLFIPFVLPEL